MSIDNTLRALAYSEASTLGLAVALIAKHRNDLDAAIRADETRAMPVASEGAALERALDAITPSHAPRAVDKIA